MSRSKKFAIGVGAAMLVGPLLTGVAFLGALVVMGVHNNISAALGALLAAPLFLLLNIVAVICTLLPASMITAGVATLCGVYRMGIRYRIFGASVGLTCGGYWGSRFVDIVQEANDTTALRVSGGLVTGLTMAGAALAISAVTSRIWRPGSAATPAPADTDPPSLPKQS